MNDYAGFFITWTTYGTWLTSFNGNGYSVFSPPGIQMTTNVYSPSLGMVALQPDGKILITSRASSGLDVDGTTTRTGESGDSVTHLPGGKILVVGTVSFSDDSLDSSYGIGGKQSINFRGLAEDLAVASDGSVVVVGYDSNNDANGNSPNSLWSSILQPAGAGNDQLEGGAGRDLMIGGLGADRLFGNADDDLLIAGYTSYDANDLALLALTLEWSSNSSYAMRVSHLQSGTGQSGGYVRQFIRVQRVANRNANYIGKRIENAPTFFSHQPF